MDAFHFHFHPAELVRAFIAWLNETTQASRSARLSTLGMTAYQRDGDGFEHPSEGRGCR